MTELIAPSGPMSPMRSTSSRPFASAPPASSCDVRRHKPAGPVFHGSHRPPNHPLWGDDATTPPSHTERVIPSPDAQHETGQRVDRTPRTSASRSTIRMDLANHI